MGGFKLFFGFGMARMLKGLMDGILLGNIGVKIPTYVRNDNFAVLYQVDSASTVANKKNRITSWEVIGKN